MDGFNFLMKYMNKLTIFCFTLVLILCKTQTTAIRLEDPKNPQEQKKRVWLCIESILNIHQLLLIPKIHTTSQILQEIVL